MCIRTGSYLSLLVYCCISPPISLHVSLFTSLVACFFSFSALSVTLIIFFESRRKQIRRETLSFVCKEKATAISQIWEPSSAIWPWLGEMWVILRPMHPIWWMVYSFDGERLAEKPGWELEMHIGVFGGGVCRECVAACVRAYQCLLCGYTAKVPTVFVFLLQQSDMLIWKGNAGIIDTGELHVVMWKANSTLHACQTQMVIFAWHYLRFVSVPSCTYWML